MEYSQRREKLLQAMSALGVEAMIVSSSDNLRYLSGFCGENAWAYISREKTAIVTDGRFWAHVEEHCPGVELIRFRSQSDGRLSKRLAAWLQEQGGVGRCGFEAAAMTYLEYRGAAADLLESKAVTELTGADEVLGSVRLIKSPAELKVIRKAAHVADQAFAQTLRSFTLGMTEAEFCAELEYQMQKHGARKPSFDTIVASGENGAYPHATVTSRAIQLGELVTIDFGVIVDGYCSDCTRTIWLGSLDERSRELLVTVQRAHDTALEAVKPGVAACELDNIARTIIKEAGYGEYFNHSLGHGVGMAVHEGPGLRAESKAVLAPGMIITIEPGIYLPGVGGCRVEDLVLVTETGYEVLSLVPYQRLTDTHPVASLY